MSVCYLLLKRAIRPLIQKWSKKTYDPQSEWIDVLRKTKKLKKKLRIPRRRKRALGLFYIEKRLRIVVADGFYHTPNVVEVVRQLALFNVFSQQVTQNSSEIFMAGE